MTKPLVSVCMPVRNGEHRFPAAIESALGQTYDNIEIIISDNASTDATQDVCRDFANRDDRISYHRHDENVGLLNNFLSAMNSARGEFFVWLGDDDELHPTFLERSVDVLTTDDSLVLTTTGVSWLGPEGQMAVRDYDDTAMRSPSPLARLQSVLKMLNEDAAVDALVSLMRREPVARIKRPNMMREDEVYLAKLALAGPWGHVPDALITRRWRHYTRPGLAQYLDVPAWQARFATGFETVQLMKVVSASDLPRPDRVRAHGAVVEHYVGWHWRRVRNRIRRK